MTVTEPVEVSPSNVHYCTIHPITHGVFTDCTCGWGGVLRSSLQYALIDYDEHLHIRGDAPEVTDECDCAGEWKWWLGDHRPYQVALRRPACPLWRPEQESEAMDELMECCPVCGDPSDYCQGHGEIGDPAGYTVLEAHDAGDHSQCHRRAMCDPT